MDKACMDSVNWSRQPSIQCLAPYHHGTENGQSVRSRRGTAPACIYATCGAAIAHSSYPGTLSRHRVFSASLACSNDQLAWTQRLSSCFFVARLIQQTCTQSGNLTHVNTLPRKLPRENEYRIQRQLILVPAPSLYSERGRTLAQLIISFRCLRFLIERRHKFRARTRLSLAQSERKPLQWQPV